jgi:hypothetical protein
MGSDNLHKNKVSVKQNRRKKKNVRNLKSAQRKMGQLEFPKMLIMADDKKSILLYLKGFHKENKVRNLEFSKEGSGLDQFSLAQKAKEKAEDYDCIFCVFDQDASHKSDPHYQKYYQALNLLKDDETIAAITSIPCYEIWLLLHFKAIDKPFTNTGRKSICDTVIDELRKCEGMQNYEKKKGEGKDDENIYQKMQPYLENAIHHAELLEESNKRNQSDNPSTKIHLLIEYLQIYSL